MLRGKRMEEWNQTAAIRATIANSALGSRGNYRPYYFHCFAEELEAAYIRHLESRDGVGISFDPGDLVNGE